MNKMDLLDYAILGITCGVFGYVLYIYVVVPHICSVTTIPNILNQCKTFDSNTRVLYAIPFVFIQIILLLIRTKLQGNNRNNITSERSLE